MSVRIVHEISGPQTVGVGTQLNGHKIGEKASSFRVDLSLWAKGEDDPESIDIEIQGNARHLRAALAEALALIDEQGEDYVAKGELDPDWAKV